MNKRYFLKTEHLNKIGLNWSEEETKQNKFVTDYLANMTIKEQFATLYEFHEVFFKCRVVKSKGVSTDPSAAVYINCEDITPIRRSIDYFL